VHQSCSHGSVGVRSSNRPQDLDRPHRFPLFPNISHCFLLGIIGGDDYVRLL
jgi:hypothetical protein